MKKSTVALVASLAFVFLTAEDCSVSAPNETKKSCDLKIHNVHKSSKSGALNVHIDVICGVPPESHTLEVIYQLKTKSGNWRDRGSVIVIQKIPPTRWKQWPAPYSEGNCISGTWRARVNVYGSLKGKSFYFRDTGKSNEVNC